jgi:F-type H+-transporting ATPase subunit b
MDILGQLKELFLQALPITVIVFLLFLFLRGSFWGPLERVLAARQQATEGARRQAEELVAQANEKLRQYEEALRQARAEIYRQQEAQRRAALDERAQLVQQARARAADSVRRARLEVARELEQAKLDLEAESARLADLIARSLLPGGKRA